MKHLKRWLALAVSAALALTLLAGCHTGGGISSRLLLDLLAGELENVQVETDSTFDRALKAAVQKGGSDPDAVLDALVEELGISGGAVNFSISGIGNASAGRQSLNVVFQPGTSASAAANNAASGWLGVLRGLSGSGEYSGLVSMVEVNGGYILAISVTVEQPGNLGSDSDDNDDNEPTPAPDLGYTKDEQGNYTVTTADGLNAWADAVLAELEKGSSSIDCTLANDITLPSAGASGSNWTPIGDFSNRYTGTFDGGGHSITGLTINSNYVSVLPSLFSYIGEYGEVKNLTLESVTINGKSSIGGIAGENHGTIENCQVTSGTITVTSSGSGNAGGIAGENKGTIRGCSSAATVKNACNTGGVVGINYNQVIACYSTGDVSGGNSGGPPTHTGGVVGQNNSGIITACYHANGNVERSGDSGTVGGVVGYNSSGTNNITACYWSGSVTNGNGIGNGGGTATEVDGTDVTWATGTNSAMSKMNEALKDKDWKYVDNSSGNPPLTLQKVTAP